MRASFRVYEELNDFLPSELRKREVVRSFVVSPSVKDAVEALGVPHVEVDLIVVDGTSVGFDYRIRDGDRIAVYPVFESIDISPVVRLRPEPLRNPRFVTDAHLGKLARLLRLLGFDTVHASDLYDGEIVALSAAEGRCILSRDRQLLRHGAVRRGRWIRSTDPIEQARETVRRFDLAGQARPFTRCTVCNGCLARVEKAAVLDRTPPRTAAWLDEYTECSSCRRLYWPGTHRRRLDRVLRRVLEA